MKKSRLFSLLTAAVLTVTGFWPNAALNASAETEFSGAKIPDSSAIAYSENSFGAMIADTINQENSRIMMSSVVHSVEMNGTEATVSYDSTQAGRAVVCVYEDVASDSAPRLLGTGIQDFTAELNTVTVPVQINALPEYYLVRVYLIGVNDVPLSAEYTDPMHTREMQTLLRSDISYYMEDYEVLNMDGSTETNYAVYNKDVTVLHYSRTENYVLSQDNENRVFEIRNYTGPTKTGTIVSVECGNGTAAIFRIGSVKTDGDVTTIQGDRSMDTNDAFAYVKLETDAANNSVTYTPPEPSEDNEGIVFSCVTDEKPVQSRPAITGMATAAEETEAESEDSQTDYQDTVHFRIQFGKGEQGRDGTTGVELDGFVDFQFDYHVTIYKSLGLDKITLDLANIIEIGAEASVTVGTKIPIGTSLVLNPTSSVIIVLGPYLDLSITGMIDLSTVFSWSYGTGQSFHANAAVTDIMLTVEGFIGVGIGGEIWGFGKGGGISVAVGLQADFATNTPHEGCVHCSDISLCLVGKFNASVDIGIVDVGIEPKIEIELLHCYLSDALGFGMGECPNLNGIPKEPDDPGDDPVDDPGNDPDNPTQKKKVLSPLEERIFTFGYAGEIDGKPVATLMRNNALEENEYTEALTEFTVPEYDDNGYKVIGIGDYCFFRLNNLKRVVLHDNILKIGQSAFLECEALEDVNLPQNLRVMGKSAFSKCGIREIRIPVSLGKVPEYAFYCCPKVEKIIIPDGITAIGDRALALSYKGTEPVRIPPSVETLGESAMNGVTVQSPVYVRNIGERALSACHFYDPETKTNTLVLSPIIKTVANKAFYGARADKVVFPRCCRTVFSPYSFEQLADVKEIVLPDNMIRIPEAMFQNSQSLEKVYWPSRLTEIGNAAFYGCLRLQNGNFPRTLRKIDARAFYQCWDLEKDRVFKLPYGLKEIGDRAFYQLNWPKEIHIPETVERMYFSSVFNSAWHLYFLNPNVEFLDDPETFQTLYASTSDVKLITVHGYNESTAQEFAANKDHYYQFKAIQTQTAGAIPVNTAKTMTFTGLLPNTVYNFYDLLGDDFTAANLLYLSQGVSDEAGTLTVFYRPKSDDTDANKYVKCASTEKPVSKIKGDANGDFVVDVSDAVLCARFCAEDVTAKISYQGIRNADVNGDGNTSPDDTIVILKYIARLITSFD